eukprot:COSAG06_NODE_1383_length_9621_cov_17.241966_8_plen_1036_part_00
MTNISAQLQLLQTLRNEDPTHITVKAQAWTALAASLSPFADLTMGEAYFGRWPYYKDPTAPIQYPCYNLLASATKLTSYYPMDWAPNMLWGDGGYLPPTDTRRTGVFVQSIQFQWMLSLARGISGNTLYVYLPYMPWLLTDSAAELGLATFEMTPFMFAPIGVMQPTLQFDNSYDVSLRLPSIVGKAWRDSSGAILVLLVNLRDSYRHLNVSVHLDGKAVTLDQTAGWMPLANHRQVDIHNGCFMAVLAALDSEVYLFNKTSSPALIQGPNRVLNPSIESYVLPGHATGWQISGNTVAISGNSTAFVFSETRFAHSGSHCLRLTTPYDTFQTAVVPLPINLSTFCAGWYTVSAWARVYYVGHPRSLKLTNGTVKIAHDHEINLNQTWQKLRARIHVRTCGDTSLNLMAGSSGTIYIDSISVVLDHDDVPSEQQVRGTPSLAPASMLSLSSQMASCSFETAPAHSTHMVVDGAPFIPMGFMADDLLVHGLTHTDYHLKVLSLRGINTLLLQEAGIGSAIDVSLQLAALDLAFASGIKAVLALDIPILISAAWMTAFTAQLRHFKDHPAVLGWWTKAALSSLDQHRVYVAVKATDPDPGHFFFSLQPNITSVACNFDVMVVPASSLFKQPIRLPAGKFAMAVGGQPMMKGRDASLLAPPFHRPAARSSELRLAVYSSLMQGAVGFVYAWFLPGTPYSITNGVGEIAMQVAELLPALTASTALTVTAAPGLLTQGFVDQTGAMHLLVANPSNEPNVNSDISCSELSNSTVWTPFSTNATVHLSHRAAVNGSALAITKPLKPLEVEVFRWNYKLPYYSSSSNMVIDPEFEDLELYPGHPKRWLLRFDNDELLNCADPEAGCNPASTARCDAHNLCLYPGQYSSALVDTRPGFVLSGRRHSLRLTRPYPVGDQPSGDCPYGDCPNERTGPHVSLLVPLQSTYFQPGQWNISIWHRTTQNAGRTVSKTYVPSLLMLQPVRGRWLTNENWTESFMLFTCVVSTAKPKCPGLFLSFDWPGQLWIGGVSVTSYKSDDNDVAKSV